MNEDLVNQGNYKVKDMTIGSYGADGVKFSKEGLLNFESTINNLKEDAYYDFIKANEAARFSSTPKGCIWHHVEDG